MKKYKIIFGFSYTFLLFGSTMKPISQSSLVTKEVKGANATDDSDKYNQYIGYGYDVTSGPLYDTANVLHLNNPILNVESSTLKNKIRQFTPSRVTYTSGTYNSKSEVAEHLGKEISGGAGASTAASIGPAVSANVDISASFNTANTESWKSVQQETFSYHNIYAQNRTVTLQIDPDEDSFTDYLNPTFLKDAKKITNSQAAESFLSKYGTHLMMGYTLGGVFEMTNYYASNSSSYTKENTTSFDTQVSAGLSVASGKVSTGTSASFSFTQTYGLSDNNAYATNQYKLQTFGGKVFPGLTIDQAFSYYETAFGAGYMYNIWTDSINDGDNLVIVNVPSNTPLLPLYRVLPSTDEYQQAKENLLAAYLKQCSAKLAKYRKNNKDVGITDMRDPSDNDTSAPSLKINGYDQYSLTKSSTDGKNEYYYSHTDKESSDEEYIVSVKPKDIIRFDYETTDLDGVNLVWKIKELKTDWYDVDPSTGLLKITEKASEAKGQKLHLVCTTSNGTVEFAKVTIKIDENAFSGGDGTESNPYLISTPDQLNEIGKMDKTDNTWFKLISDINLNGVSLNKIGASDNQFVGKIDGNYHTIKNYTISDLGSADKDGYTRQGFVSYLGTSGAIRNLTLQNFNVKIHDVIANDKQKIGLLVGESTGEIENCHVKESALSIYSVKNAAASMVKSIGVGGLVGVQAKGGYIKSSEVRNTRIVVNTNNIQCIAVGGLIGEKNSERNNKVEQCSVIDSSVSVSSLVTSSSASDKIIINYIGGFVGYSSGEGSTYSNCLITGTNVSLNDLTQKIDGYNPTVQDYVGGFIGYYFFDKSNVNENFDNLTSFDCVFVNQTDHHVELNYKYTGSGQKSGCKMGSFVGMVGGDSFTGTQLPGNDVVIYNACNSTYVGNQTFNYITSEVSSVNGFDSTYWDSGVNAKRKIKYKLVDSVEFDFSNAPKTFKYNEEFTTGNGIIVQRYFADGSDMEEVVDYYVDYSDYKKDAPGSYTINATADGKTDSYVVTVEGPELKSLKLENKPTNKYYVGDKFEFDTAMLYAYYSDGTKKQIALDDPDLVIDAPKKLAVGQNKITYTYKGASTYLVVEAAELKIKSYEILNKDELEGREYKIKDKTVDLSGMQIKVTYENADPRIINYDDNEDDFSAFYSKFQYGDNEIKISYKDYTMNTITIHVAYSTDFASQVSQFISIINQLSSTDNTLDMTEQFSLIKKAERLQKEIGNFTGDSNYDAACRKFEEIKQKYNEQVNTINSDFESVIELNSSFVYGSIFSVAIPFSLVAILILFFVL